MSSACLTMTLPVDIEAMWGYLRDLFCLIEGSANNPHLGGVRGWTFDGDEVVIADWESTTLREHNIQGLTFWLPDGRDVFVSWEDAQVGDPALVSWQGSPLQGKRLSFSEAGNDAVVLQKVFGFLARSVLPSFRERLPDRPLLVFSYR